MHRLGLPDWLRWYYTETLRLSGGLGDPDAIWARGRSTYFDNLSLSPIDAAQRDFLANTEAGELRFGLRIRRLH